MLHDIGEILALLVNQVFEPSDERVVSQCSQRIHSVSRHTMYTSDPPI